MKAIINPGLGFMILLAVNKKWRKFPIMALYFYFKDLLPKDQFGLAPLWALAIRYYKSHKAAVLQAGISSGDELFRKITTSESGLIISHHQFDDVWRMLGYKDKKIRLAIKELLECEPKKPSNSTLYPLTLIAGERRSYNANTIYRDNNWRKSDSEGFLRIHPKMAEKLSIGDHQKVICESAHGRIIAMTKICDSMQEDLLSLPHGYGLSSNRQIANGDDDIEHIGPNINDLTHSDECDPLTKTPHYKQVMVRLLPVIGS